MQASLRREPDPTTQGSGLLGWHAGRIRLFGGTLGHALESGIEMESHASIVPRAQMDIRYNESGVVPDRKTRYIESFIASTGNVGCLADSIARRKHRQRRLASVLAVAGHADHLGLTRGYCVVYSGGTAHYTYKLGADLFVLVHRRDAARATHMGLVDCRDDAESAAEAVCQVSATSSPSSVFNSETRSLIELNFENAKFLKSSDTDVNRFASASRVLTLSNSIRSNSYSLVERYGEPTQSLDQLVNDACCIANYLIDRSDRDTEQFTLEMHTALTPAALVLRCIPGRAQLSDGFFIGGGYEVLI